MSIEVWRNSIGWDISRSGNLHLISDRLGRLDGLWTIPVSVCLHQLAQYLRVCVSRVDTIKVSGVSVSLKVGVDIILPGPLQKPAFNPRWDLRNHKIKLRRLPSSQAKSKESHFHGRWICCHLSESV